MGYRHDVTSNLRSIVPPKLRRRIYSRIYKSPARSLVWTEPRFVIVGTGRCGTKYVSQVLTKAGIKTGHEQWWNVTDRKARGLKGDASWFAVFNLDGYSGHVFHQVRDPIKVIRSMVQVEVAPGVIDNIYGQFRARYLKFTRDPMQDAMLVVDRWLQGAEEVSQFTYRVEDLNVDLLVGMMKRAGFDLAPPRASEAIASVPTDVNDKPHLKSEGLDLGWTDLPNGALKDRLLAHAERFNYV